APGEDGPRAGPRIEELHGRHVEMRGIAPGKEVQRSRVGGTGVDGPGTHGQPDGRRGQFGAVRLRVGQVFQRGAAELRGLDRISDSILPGCDAYADLENAGRTGRAPV